MKSLILYLLYCIIYSYDGASIPVLKQEGILREARLILPKETNDGQPLLPIIVQQLESKLLSSFGGFTNLEGVGGWESGSLSSNDTLSTLQVHHEPVWIYDIGCVDNPQTEAELKQIALWVKVVAFQESVYLRLPSGEIMFV